MRIDILTLFPKMFKNVFSESILKRAQEKGLLEIKIHNLRKWGLGRHKQVDDRPYGGGIGMILRVDVIDKALTSVKKEAKSKNSKTILLTPQGKLFNQSIAKKLSKLDRLILLCGHYEGVDERVRKLVDLEISIGDYILTGGEIPAMVLVDAIGRLIKGVIEKKEALRYESFEKGLLEYPQYTRPFEYKKMKVPEILLSGDHKKIKEWREKQALLRTKKRRPDLLK